LRKGLRKTFGETPSANSAGVYSSFDIIGDIAVTKMPGYSSVNPEDVAEAIMKRHKNVKVVFLQNAGVRGDFRLRGLTQVIGEKRTCTVHRESGCQFKVDVEKCYFSPRLSGERQRIALLVQPNEIVVNMFAGVGCFSIIIAKHVDTAKIYSIDVNPAAVKFMTENVRLNRVYGKVIPILGDAKVVIEKNLQGVAERVLMPLPEKAMEYLPYAVEALKLNGGWIHLHTFEHADKTESSAEKAKQKVEQALRDLGVAFEVPMVRVVRSTGPNWWQLVTDVQVA
jgi:tRNA (guanine37-N1)-methyltransferase